MTCSHCMKEYGNDVQVCPQCGGTLAYGAAPAPVGAFDPNGYVPGAQENQMNLGTTFSVSGSNSIRGRLRPRNVIEIITEAFHLYKENWKLFAMVVLVFYVPAMVFQMGWQVQYANFMQVAQSHQVPNNAMSMLGSIGIWTLLFVVSIYGAMFLINYSLTRAVSDIYLGKKVELREIIRPNNRFWGFVGASLICGLAMMAVMIVCMIPMIGGIAATTHHGSADPTAAIVMVLGMFATMFGCCLVLPAIAVWFIAVWPAAVVEGQGSLGAIRRGISLVRGFYWKAAGLLILTVLISSTINYLIISPYMMTVFYGTFSHGFAAGNGVVAPYYPSIPVLGMGGVLGLLGGCVTMPMVMLPIVLFYYDLRIRKEGFDLQMLAEQLGYGVNR